MNSTELLELFRADINDAVKPYLWTDEEIYAYMGDAYMQFWRLVGGIGDMTSDEASLVVAAQGEEFSDLHPSLLTIREAHRVVDSRRMTVTNAEQLPVMTSDSDYGNTRSLLLDQTTGAPGVAVIGLERGKVRWCPIPDQNYDVRLLVYRLPLEGISGEDQELSELDVMHHIHLMKWMRAMAYQKQDAETFDRAKAAEAEAQFRAYCAQAKREWDRYRHKPSFTAYGGYPINNGPGPYPRLVRC